MIFMFIWISNSSRKLENQSHQYEYIWPIQFDDIYVYMDFKCLKTPYHKFQIYIYIYIYGFKIFLYLFDFDFFLALNCIVQKILPKKLAHHYCRGNYQPHLYDLSRDLWLYNQWYLFCFLPIIGYYNLHLRTLVQSKPLAVAIIHSDEPGASVDLSHHVVPACRKRNRQHINNLFCLRFYVLEIKLKKQKRHSHLGKMKQIQNKYWFSSKFDQTLTFKGLSFVKVWSNFDFQKSEFCQSLIKLWLSKVLSFIKVWSKLWTFKSLSFVKVWWNSDF